MNYLDATKLLRSYGGNLQGSDMNPYYARNLPDRRLKYRFLLSIGVAHSGHGYFRDNWNSLDLDDLLQPGPEAQLIGTQNYHILMDMDELSYTLSRMTLSRCQYLIYKAYYFNITRDTYNKSKDYFLKKLNIDITHFHLSHDDHLPDNDAYYLVIKFKDNELPTNFEELLDSQCDGIESFQYHSYSRMNDTAFYAKNITKNFMLKFNLLKDVFGATILGLKIDDDFYKRFE